MVTFLAILCHLSTLCLWSQPSVPELNTAIKAILEDDCFETAGLGFMVCDASSGKVIVDHESQLAVPPASTLKLWTTAAALDLLGGDFRFQTDLGYTGTISGDTLHGSIVIRGFGDPTLGSSHFGETSFPRLLDEMVGSITQAGIRAITGTVIGDASFLPLSSLPPSWLWQDLGNYYGGPYMGLNVHDNLYYLDFRQASRPGQEVEVSRIFPEVPDLHLESFVVAGPPGSGDQAYIMGAPLQFNRWVTGSIPPGQGIFTIKGSLPDPAAFLAWHLAQKLKDQQVICANLPKSVYQPINSPLSHLASWYSPPLEKIAALTNEKSINLFAEGLGRYLQKLYPPENGKDFLEAYWEGKGVDLLGCRFTDYAGLAQDNAMTARAMVDMLTLASKVTGPYAALEGTMAVGGESGTLQYLWRSSPAKGKIVGKSGLIRGVRNYAGYIYTDSGRKLAFAVLTQNPVCNSSIVRKKLEQLLETVYLSFP